MNQEKQVRNSSIELLKVVAIAIIVFSHAMPVPNGFITFQDDFAMPLEMATANVQRLLILLMKYGGQFGNDIFIICSAWFLLDSKRTNISKVIYMIGDCFLISVLFLLIFLGMGYHLSAKEILMQVFPVLTSANWFVTCYIIVYLIHRALNIVIYKLRQKELLATVLLMLVLYSGFNYIFRESLFYNYLIGFICVYFLTGYIKLYVSETSITVRGNVILLLVSSAGNLGIIGITNLLGLSIPLFADKLTHWNAFISPFTLFAAIAVFQLVRTHSFVNRGINYLSSLSLLIYIIHDNRLVINHLLGEVYRYIYHTFGYDYELLWVLLYGSLSLLCAGLLSSLYKGTLQKLVHKLCDCIYNTAYPLAEKILEAIMHGGG